MMIVKVRSFWVAVYAQRRETKAAEIDVCGAKAG